MATDPNAHYTSATLTAEIVRTREALKVCAEALRALREDDNEHGECQRFERESVGDNMSIDVIDLRCETCRRADEAFERASELLK